MQRFYIVLVLIALGVTGYSQNSLSILNNKSSYLPLDTILVSSTVKGKIEVYDATGDIYFYTSIKKNIEFIVGGALGSHVILLKDKKDILIGKQVFSVDCKTEINDASGKYNELLDVLYYSMTKEWRRQCGVNRFNGKDYHMFVPWLRDHVHALKGMKYFYPELKSGIDLYGDSQREDGMIWDNYTHDYNTSNAYWLQRFKYANFAKYYEGNDRLFTRIPAENDVEYLFIEGIYYTWKATGDTEWMKGMLNKALKAVEYSTTSTYRWSDKYQLLKRAYTIDTWDFQNHEDAVISCKDRAFPDEMIITNNTRFGVMFGDNTGMIASLQYLSEMLTVANRKEDAEKMQQLSKNLEQRLNQLSWNGEFYTHHISEDTSIVRDFGVDEKSQVSLSNSYSINRGISHDKAVSIINTYQRIKTEMPVSSPGEFYTIYPPFEKGYRNHNSKWNYMNGGVISIVAGELAHGAFENGFENYGVDILNRQLALAKTTDNYLHCTYRGQMPEEPNRSFATINISDEANTDFVGNTQNDVMGWTNEGENDLHEFPTGDQVFKGVKFNVVNPDENGRKACIGLSKEQGYKQQSTVKVNKKAESIYFLHTTNKNTYCGSITIKYADGSNFIDYITPKKIINWWYPNIKQDLKQMPNLQIAWQGKNNASDNVSVAVYGLNNPNPNKVISEIVFDVAKDGTKWMILGVTISDYEVHFTPSIISDGIPDNWGAAAVTYALIEGLAGVKDEGNAYSEVLLAPRWEAANENMVDVTIKYEASKSYVSYQYSKTESEIKIIFTGTQKKTNLQIMLPENKNITAVLLNDKSVDYKELKIESSKYINLKIDNKGVFNVKITLN